VNVSEVLAETLRAAGIPFAAGHPGGEVTHLIEGLRRRGVPFYLTRHEATAAFLAAAYGELTGRPGLCIATLGPGATNLISGVAHAYLDRAPLLALTGQIPTDRYLRFPHQRLDLGGLYRPVTKLTVRLEAETVRETVHLALRLAVTERPGPVHLELPSNVAAQPAAERPGLAERWGDWLPVAGSEGAVAADPAALQAALDRLERARRPLIAVGLAALRGHAPAHLVGLAERLGAPVVTTTKAKGVIPEDHPLAAGVFDMYGEAVVRELVGQSDCVLAVGLDATEFIHPWTFTVPVVYLDTVPNTDQFVPAVCEVVGPLGEQLEGAAQDLPAHPGLGGAPLALGSRRRGERALPVGRRRVRHRGEDAPVGGVVHLEGRGGGGVDPLPADEELAGDGVEDGLVAGHHPTLPSTAASKAASKRSRPSASRSSPIARGGRKRNTLP